ncbi:doubled CXXCH domain-containing protein [Malonomonas rubra DSM 5091]|uniref:Doubled CXXCH domain-containing protein n=1 Tax=Malonomonas rubra DSM 5091 TaxID=1122189 RepID=A0A1M6HYB1_MALRU|nr:hypothetical protein [Malonomonas rubra]SHJ27161.1 doubled CXXCH domain-containing protein [Malonomonas rubra DSM 5091]
MKKSLMIISAIFFSLCLTGTAFAFHGGGVAHCDGCHSMHAGNGNDRFGAQGPSLTNGSDASSTCLNCHDGSARYHVNSAGGDNTNEGGDFHWTADNGYAFVQRGNVVAINNNNFGHNMLAADFGLANDTDLAAAPGGGFPSAGFGCTGCHDPHGQAGGGTIGGALPISVSGSYGEVPAAGTQAGNYRILYDSNRVGFAEDAPIARANSYDGASVQYGDGMSGWCANCHLGFYTQSASGGMHPTDVAVPATYDSYVATGNFTGVNATAYDPLVPIERGGVTASSELPDPEVAADAGFGTTGTSQVMCLTCHRAHASPFENALRWDYTTSEFIAENWTHLTGTGAVLPDPAVAALYYKHGTVVDVALDPQNPWDGGYGEYQRSLCNKCHVQD